VSEKKKIKLIHEGRYAAEVEVELIDDDTGWAPYLSVSDARKLDAVRAALKAGQLAEAAVFGRVFELQPVGQRERGITTRCSGLAIKSDGIDNLLVASR